MSLFVEFCTKGNFRVSKTLTFKVHNLSCENEFYLHENQKSFPYQRLTTWPRFDTEARANSEMAWAELAFAKTSRIVTWDAPVSYWPILFLPVSSNSPRSLCESSLDPASISFLRRRVLESVSKKTQVARTSYLRGPVVRRPISTNLRVSIGW